MRNLNVACAFFPICHRISWECPASFPMAWGVSGLPPRVSRRLRRPEARGEHRGKAATPPRVNRTITVAWQNEATSLHLLGDSKAFGARVLAFSLGYQLTPTTTCRGGGCLTRHAHAARVRMGERTRAVRLPWAWPSGGTNGMLKREQHTTCANSQTDS